MTCAGILCLFSAALVGCGKDKGPQSLTIAFSNDMAGEIRSCGCVSQDLGGLGRRATFLDGQRKRAGENFLLFDGGDAFGIDVNYGKEKADLTLQSFNYMNYTAMVVGEKDLVHGVEFLKERANALKFDILAANLIDTETGEAAFPPTHVEVLPGGIRVGIIGVIEGVTLPEGAPASRYELSNARNAIDRLVPILRDEHTVDIVVVLAHMPSQRLRRMAKGLTGVDVIVSGHDACPARQIQVIGGAYILTTGNGGRYVGVGYGTTDQNGRLASLSAELSPLTNDFEDHQAITKLFQSYDLDVRRMEKARAGTIAPEHMKRRYAGEGKCLPCHKAIHDHWKETKHAHAFDILVQQDRQYDRDCTPCHTAGFFEIGGFVSADATPDLVDVQCESCHGNSAAHAGKPVLKTEGDARNACYGCHNEQQTPEFDFEKWWSRIRHPK
jgi:predicted CXXCH cytochrome family protein